MESTFSAQREPLPFFAEKDPSTLEVIYGPGSISQVGEKARKMGDRALLVTDVGLSKAGHAASVHALLKTAGLEVAFYDRSIENPTERSVRKCFEFAKRSRINLIVGLGGGSSMDTAKGCNFLYTNGGRMSDYWGVGRAEKTMLPLLAIPTTAGTGSECQSFALISDDQTHCKMACGDPKALPAVTILDPVLTLSQPAQVTASTGIDALAHALESAVCIKRNESSYRHSQIAFRLIERNLAKVLKDPGDLNARGELLLGASHAGAAIERSMLGAAHSMANPLTARKRIVHGMAVGMALPAVMSYNAIDPAVCEIYADLARSVELVEQGDSDSCAAARLIRRVCEFLDLAGFPGSLAEVGFAKSEVMDLAVEASEQWTAGFNPRSVGPEVFEKIFAQLLDSTTCVLEQPWAK